VTQPKRSKSERTLTVDDGVDPDRIELLGKIYNDVSRTTGPKLAELRDIYVRSGGKENLPQKREEIARALVLHLAHLSSESFVSTVQTIFADRRDFQGEYAKWFEMIYGQPTDNERPWVGLDTVSSPEWGPNAPVAADVVIKNTGHTPARQMKAHFLGTIEPQGPPPAFPDMAGIAPKPLFPDTKDYYRPFEPRRILSREQHEDLIAGNQIAWVIGRIEYLDIRGRRCWTTVCTRWDPIRNCFVPHETGNDAA
jgi:hypothetical protein